MVPGDIEPDRFAREKRVEQTLGIIPEKRFDFIGLRWNESHQNDAEPSPPPLFNQ